jgi:soluble lytic murein transglycosylase-like protein
MSIQTLARRVAEVESILDSLSSARGAMEPVNATQTPGTIADGPATPFNVLLSSRLGATGLRPAPESAPADLAALADHYAAANGLDPALVRAVIQAESNWKVDEVSPKGAKGLMQLMPEDCVAYNVSDPFDPRQNLAAGTKQLADKLREQGGNLELALAAYNAGSGAVRHYKGVPPYTETLNYIRRVKALMGR